MKSVAIFCALFAVSTAQLAAWPSTSYSPFYQALFGGAAAPAVAAAPAFAAPAYAPALGAPAPVASPMIAAAPALAAASINGLPVAAAPAFAPAFAPAAVPAAVPAYAPFQTAAYWIGSNKAKTVKA